VLPEVAAPDNGNFGVAGELSDSDIPF